MKKGLFLVLVAFLASMAMVVSAPAFVDDSLNEYYTGAVPPVEPTNRGPSFFGMATVTSSGDITASRLVDSVTWDSTNNRWLVTFTGQNYYFTDYITVVTPIGTGTHSVTCGSISGDLTVYIHDTTTGNRVQAGFYVVTLKP